MDLDTLISQLRSLRDEDPDEERAIDGIGCALSYASRWDGIEIMKVCAMGLTDANFHTAAAAIDRMISDELAEFAKLGN